ncbi:MAG: TonB-dependent receptor [Hyphococcus sp.]|nr:MAG: TonB-dependent receptor [Marinicaulis sp.]
MLSAKAPRRLSLFATTAMGALLLSQTGFATSYQADDGLCDASVLTCTAGDRVIYKPGFFSDYNPVTALDMVERVPGFSIDEGDDVRGFGGAGGNVLIDGQRPSSKSTDITDRLTRIGADNVARIELIRGGTGALDVGGQSVVVNVILSNVDGASEPSPWELSITKRRPGGWVRPGGEVSFNGHLGDIKYTLGLNASAVKLAFNGEEQITRFFGDDEFRVREGNFSRKDVGGNLNLEKSFANGDIVRFNVEAGYENFRDSPTETRFLETGGPDVAMFPLQHILYRYEVGADYEHKFSDVFGIKVIALMERVDDDDEFRFELFPAVGANERSLFVPQQNTGETIGRLEFDWAGLKGHSIQFGGEVVHNFLENSAEFFVDDGSGVLVSDDVDGSNTRVTEIRGEPFINDSWTLSPAITLDLGFAFEFSKISQSGDTDNSRFFTYPKPSLTLTYRMGPQTQFRLSGERKVNQLSFNQFVSSVNFDDEDVDFGNPELQPQRTWAFRAEFEQRFGDIGVISLAGFYDYVQDVEDLLPLSGTVEVPGNIGDGTLWGGTFELTAPLDFMGLKNARLESSVTVQDSSVVDPVTGLDRKFSFEEDYEYDISFRQDFPDRKISWGVSAGNRGDELGFGLDEFTTFSRDLDLSAFIETTALKGIKIKLDANDILNVNNARDRTVFVGSRALGVPNFREQRSNQNGGGVTLTFSGTF